MQRMSDSVFSMALAAPAGRASWPEGRRGRRSNGRTVPVWEVIRKNCTSCHGIDDYAFYALDQSRLAEADRGEA